MLFLYCSQAGSVLSFGSFAEESPPTIKGHSQELWKQRATTQKRDRFKQG